MLQYYKFIATYGNLELNSRVSIFSLCGMSFPWCSLVEDTPLELGGTQNLKMVWYFIKYHGINNYYGI